MKAWERRLKDLSHILVNCEKTYFEPELFRMNLNQFLQTARTHSLYKKTKMRFQTLLIGTMMQ